jgi:hypothetical protein
MNDILHDLELRDLILRCESAYRALDAAFLFDALTPDEFRDLADTAMNALAEASDYLSRLREQRHALVES